MNRLKLIAFLSCFCISFNLFAQTPKAIEADLHRLFSKIDDWRQKQADTTISAGDSLQKADELFGKKLKYYTSRYPGTMGQAFDLLRKEGLGIVTSSDGLFRIYSWDNDLGGTMRYYENVFQYRSGPNVNSILKVDTSGDGSNYNYYYESLYTLNANGHAYYLAIYDGKFSQKDAGEGIRVFAIENGKLNEDVKLIKTANGLHSKLYYNYDYFSLSDKVKDADIRYDAASKTISIPIITAEGQATNGHILYKFTGQYFERVKN